MHAIVLVVDDLPFVLSIVSHSLARAGFQVLSAASGEEAARIAGETPRIDALVCDVIMPGMSGQEVAREVRSRHPEVKCLFMTGLPNLEITISDTNGHAMLAKPFLPNTLVSQVRSLLGLEQATAATA